MKKIKAIANYMLQPPITSGFLRKLNNNLHTLTPFEMILYFLFISPFWSKDRRFFFQGSLFLQGQMYALERKTLFDLIVSEKPRQCFEIGTFTGGGSTFFLSAAFSKIGSGTLFTMESDERLFNKAKTFFEKKLPHQNKHIVFIHGEQPTEFDKYILSDKKIDCVFFDGAENSSQTLEQYKYFEPYFKPGSIIMFHDWNTEKTASIKPIISSMSQWSKIIELNPPDSIGFAAFRYV